MNVTLTDEGVVACAVFALCENAAEGVIAHPVLEHVPACARCAAKVEEELTPAEFNFAD